MAIAELFYRWEHTPECKKAQRELNRASNDLNRESRKLTKADKDPKKDKVLISNLSRTYYEKLSSHAEKAGKLLTVHEGCSLIPRWSSPPEK